MPNPNTLPYYHCQDIQLQDVTLKSQFEQYWSLNEYQNALSILKNTQLQNKTFIADLINVLNSGILSLETEYNNSVPIFLSNLATQYSLLISNMLSQGQWNNNVQYTPFNFVIYNNDIYMCIAKPPIGTLPSNTQYWLYLGLRGEQGEPGIDVVMKYTWNSSTTYSPNELVVYGTNIYVALSQNTGVIPGTNDNIWGIFITTTPGKINIGTTSPLEPVQNEIWFKTQVDPLVQTSSTPIIGQFYRYNVASDSWEIMYPNVLFRWLDRYEDYAPTMKLVNINIQPSQWQNNQFIYTYPTLNSNSFVQIYPSGQLNETQFNLYNGLTVNVTNYSIIITAKSDAVFTSLSLIIKIQ